MQTDIQREPYRAPRLFETPNIAVSEKVKYKFHEDMTPAPKDSIFVFGSNLAGFHGAGAALAAFKYYGAALGVGEGPTGNAYAIPTKDRAIKTLPLQEIHKAVQLFVLYTRHNPEKQFFVTRVGCGLAGYKDEQIAPMFRGAVGCSFAEEWKGYL